MVTKIPHVLFLVAMPYAPRKQNRGTVVSVSFYVAVSSDSPAKNTRDTQPMFVTARKDQHSSYRFAQANQRTVRQFLAGLRRFLL